MRRGIFTDRTPSVGGRGITIRWNEQGVREMLGRHGPVAAHLDQRVGPVLVQEQKRLAPVSPDGNHGRPSGYLRSTIGFELGEEDGVVVLDAGSHALTPNGTDYGYIVAVGHETPSGTHVPPNDYLTGALRVVNG